MIEALEPLAALPGVELAMLVTEDGVPITAHGTSGNGSQKNAGREQALAAVSTGWLSELARATGPISWDEPNRVTLRCARGALIMRRMRNAVLIVVLSRGLSPEDVRLSMDGVVARLERGLRGMGNNTSRRAVAPPSGEMASNGHVPEGPLPAPEMESDSGSGTDGNENEIDRATESAGN